MLFSVSTIVLAVTGLDPLPAVALPGGHRHLQEDPARQPRVPRPQRLRRALLLQTGHSLINLFVAALPTQRPNKIGHEAARYSILFHVES
jgi:hypothetical protein